MKARVIVILMLVVGLMGTSAHSFPPKRTDKGYVDAVTKGADMWIQLSVVDDDGAPVPDADVRATFAFHDGFRHAQGRTDSLGKVSVKGITTGDEIVLRIVKEGYYCSEYKTSYLRFAENRAVEDGKWQPWGEERTLVLRKILNPVQLKRFYGFLDVPMTNEWIGLDLEMGDWIAPHGKGKTEDLQLNVSWDGLPKAKSRDCSVAVRIPGNLNAGYFSNKIIESEYASAIRANTNAIYTVSAFNWIERVKGVGMKENSYWKDRDFVVRLRSEANAEGLIVKANYCCVRRLEVNPGAKGHPVLGLRCVFNDKINDYNLEMK